MFHAGAELVPTAATVRDGEGRLVTSLQREDFTVSESGTDQPITQFTRERVPLNLALILDVSDSMRGPRMDDARLAVKTFLEELLKPEDEAALLVFNHATHVLSNWTTDREPLLAALADTRPTGGTAIYDAVNTAIPLFTDRRHPRAAMVLVSDGADTASDTTVIDLKQRLSRGDVFLYGVAIDTPNARSSQRINPQVFRELSAQSGGYAEVIGSTGGDGSGHGPHRRGIERPVHVRIYPGHRGRWPISIDSRSGQQGAGMSCGHEEGGEVERQFTVAQCRGDAGAVQSAICTLLDGQAAVKDAIK